MQLEEPFDTEHQICSSTMPQKRNPVLCENVRGVAKLIRSNANAMGERSIMTYVMTAPSLLKMSACLKWRFSSI